MLVGEAKLILTATLSASSLAPAVSYGTDTPPWHGIVRAGGKGGSMTRPVHTILIASVAVEQSNLAVSSLPAIQRRAQQMRVGFVRLAARWCAARQRIQSQSQVGQRASAFEGALGEACGMSHGVYDGLHGLRKLC